MHSFNQPERTPLSFGVVKQILREFEVEPHREGLPAQTLRIFWPLDPELAERARAGASSLTDASTSDEQIRFFQKHRARRNYIKVASEISERCGAVCIRIGNCDQLDEPSRDFLSVAAAVCGWRIDYTPKFLESLPSSSAWAAEDEEILRVVASEEVGDRLDEVWVAAFEFINVGDAWTGVALGKLMVKHEQSPRMWNLLALGHAMLSETEQAEFYYRRWAADGGVLDKVRAFYGIAMLYARHHPEGLRSLDVADMFLQDAYELLEQMDPVERARDAIVFEDVFNRNGQALILFRRGEVDAALALLEWGIARLTATGEKVAIHRSVLLYNLAQCHRQLGDLSAAIEAYERLLVVDPFMAEYRFEAAKCHAEAGDLAAAITAVEAGLSLDDSLAAGWSLLGVYFDRAHEVNEAVRAFGQAHALNPKSPKYALDFAYTLLLSGKPEQARATLRHVHPDTRELAQRRAVLLAESWLKEGDVGRAIEELESALGEMPNSETLARNLSILRPR